MSYTKRRVAVTGTQSAWLYDSDGKPVAESISTNRESDAARLAACWNACLGFEDPEADIRALRKAAARLCEDLRPLKYGTLPPDHPWEKSRALRAALARWKEEA